MSDLRRDTGIGFAGVILFLMLIAFMLADIADTLNEIAEKIG